MKIIILILLFASTLAFSQPKTKIDSYTIQRLIIKNYEGKILVYKGKSFWMTPALRHNENESITEGLQNLAGSYGLEISQPKLAGLFTYKFSFKQGVSFRSFYTANIVGTDDANPPAPITQIKWIAPEEILNIVGGIDVRKNMLKHVIKHPETLWGGSFYLFDDENGKRSSNVLEDFYSLR